LDVDYKNQFDEANYAIDVELRQLAAQLFILDRSVFRATDKSLQPAGHSTGSWVRQGTVVLVGKKGGI